MCQSRTCRTSAGVMGPVSACCSARKEHPLRRVSQDHNLDGTLAPDMSEPLSLELADILAWLHKPSVLAQKSKMATELREFRRTVQQLSLQPRTHLAKWPERPLQRLQATTFLHSWFAPCFRLLPPSQQACAETLQGCS